MQWTDGVFYPDQLAGPYELATGHPLYPPIAYPFFALLSFLPAPIWGLVPFAVIGGVIAYHRPRWWAWPLISSCLGFRWTVMLGYTGNPTIWIAEPLCFRGDEVGSDSVKSEAASQRKRPVDRPAPTLPVTLAERIEGHLPTFAAHPRESLLAASSAVGLEVVDELMGAEVDALVGPEGKLHPGRAAYRHGTDPGTALGDRRLAVRRPRVRTAVRGLVGRHRPGGTRVRGRDAAERLLRA